MARKIKITKCSEKQFWYAPFVGKEIESNKIFQDGTAHVHNSIITKLRGVPSLDGLIAQGDYEILITPLELHPSTKAYLKHVQDHQKSMDEYTQSVLKIPKERIGNEK